MKKKNTLVWAGVAGVIIMLIGGLVYYNTLPGPLDDFASCLEEKGTKFYGAFWCPHCQNQKQLFGRSERKLPYIECSLPSGQGQNAICTEAGINSYPTWEFADGSRQTGELTLDYLATKTGCALPQ